MYLDHVQAVGIHGLIFSELQRLHYQQMLAARLFPAAPHRRDFQYHVQLDASTPTVEFSTPPEETAEPRVVAAKAHQFASIAYDPPTLLWSFANFFADYRDKTPIPRAILDFGLANDLAGFTTESWAYSDQDLSVADAAPLATELLRFLGGCSVEILGPGYLPIYVSTSATSRQLILVEGFHPHLPALEFADVHRHLAEVLRYMVAARHSIHLPLQGLARHMSWQFHHEPLTDGNQWSIGTAERWLTVSVRNQNGHLVVDIQVHPATGYLG
ncbi:hypothetical protein QVA66_00925 [Staphylococcus chromogenes]|nr:hypothetical protein [Staphylococcus chromogenes]